jgi:hypothetical protein
MNFKHITHFEGSAARWPVSEWCMMQCMMGTKVLSVAELVYGSDRNHKLCH